MQKPKKHQQFVTLENKIALVDVRISIRRKGQKFIIKRNALKCLIKNIIRGFSMPLENIKYLKLVKIKRAFHIVIEDLAVEANIKKELENK